MLALCFFSTFKYHKRFNLERKFHEMANIDFDNSSPAKQLDNKFFGLKWITPIGLEKDKVLKEMKSIKGIKNNVAGSADVLLVPSFETGNGLVKMMIYFMGACAAGVVVGGKFPVVITSRSDDAPARLASIAAAIVALD